jgi:hypothetical protein
MRRSRTTARLAIDIVICFVGKILVAEERRALAGFLRLAPKSAQKKRRVRRRV